MNNYSWKKHYALRKQFDKENNWIPEHAGIYLWTRYDSDINKWYFYIGQAKNLRNRRFDYYKIQTGLSYPTRHFEASLKSHKDWGYDVKELCDESQLDEREKYWIHYYMCKDNFITRNDSLTGSDITKTNANRITKIKKEYEQAIQKSLKNLNVFSDNSALVLSVQLNKDHTVSKRSEDALKTLKERLGVKNNNEI